MLIDNKKQQFMLAATKYLINYHILGCHILISFFAHICTEPYYYILHLKERFSKNVIHLFDLWYCVLWLYVIDI